MRKTLVLACLALVFTAPAFGFSWTFHDFGGTVFDDNNNTSPIDYPNIGYLPSPGHGGEGGEGFDLEGLFFAEDDAYLYIGLTSSFGLGAMSEDFGVFSSGDVFFGFDGNKYDYAINVEEGSLYAVDEWSYIPERPGSYGGRPMIKNMVGAYQIVSGDIIGEAGLMLTFERGLETNPLRPPMDASGDTWVWEFRIAKEDLDVSQYSSITIHNTLECGNDLIEETFPRDPIPEPTTLMLLGSGLLGMGVLRKRFM